MYLQVPPEERGPDQVRRQARATGVTEGSASSVTAAGLRNSYQPDMDTAGDRSAQLSSPVLFHAFRAKLTNEMQGGGKEEEEG